MKSLRAPLCLFGLPALLVWLMPSSPEVLLHQRSALFAGEWWRLWTGHWVHFSPSHAGWNLAVLGATGAWLEHLQPGWLIRLAALGAPLISLILLASEPGMQAYGGLSALATGTAVLLALVQLQRPGPGRSWWWAILGLVAAKCGLDAVHPAPLFAGWDQASLRNSAVAHAAGAAVAATLFLTRSLLAPALATSPALPPSP